MKMNNTMREYFLSNNIFTSFTRSLLNKVSIDYFEKYNCIFLKQFEVNAKYNSDKFQDEAGYEIFVNSFHVEDYIKKNYIKAAYCFVLNALAYWKNNIQNLNFCGLISTSRYQGKLNVVVKLYVNRGGEHYIDDQTDFERFTVNHVFLITSNDICSMCNVSKNIWLPPWDLLTEETKSKILQDAARVA